MALALFFLAIPAGWILFVVVVAVVAWSIVVSQPPHLGAIDGQALRGFFGPLLVATGIALISIPILASTLGLFDILKGISSDTPTLPTDDIRRWTTVAGCAVPSVLAAATLGAPAVRRHRLTGGVFTFLVALGVAIAAMPMVLALLGQHLGAEKFCLDACSAIIESGNPASGLIADVCYAWTPLFEPMPMATLALGVSVWTAIVRAFFAGTSQPHSGPDGAPIEGGLGQ